MDNNIVEIQNIALKLKLNPTKEQFNYFQKSFGCARFVYNHYLAEKNNFYETHIKPLREEFGYFDLLTKSNNLKEENKKLNKKKKSFEKDKKRFKLQIKEIQNQIKANKQKVSDLKIEIEGIKEFTSKEYKNYKETPLKELKEQNPWLKEVEAQNLCVAQINLKSAFKNFYEGRTNLPTFHKRKENNSYSNCMISQKCLNWNDHTITIPKIGEVKFYGSQPPKWYKNRIRTRSLTVSKSAANDIYVSVLFEIKVLKSQKSDPKTIDENQIIGLDFDCDDMYIDSNGKSAKKDFGFRKQKQFHSKKLAHLQRQWSRKCKNSKNKEKARIKLAKFEEHIANSRKDFIEKESLRLVNSYKVIGVEDLNIRGMMKGSKNAKNYQDIAWSTFVGKLQWKAQNKDCRVIKIDRFFASSQICSCCGSKNPIVQKKHLERWICPQCGTEHQRDVNAAKNIAAEAYKKVLSEAEESLEKSLAKSNDFVEDVQMDTDSVLSTKQLANLALND